MATENTPAKTNPIPANDEWTVVSEGSSAPETKIVMENKGDSFTGIYLGMRTIPSPTGEYQQARWEIEGHGICFMNANWSLRQGLTKVRVRTMTRITLSDFQDTGQESLMSVYEVAVKGSVTPSANGRLPFITTAK